MWTKNTGVKINWFKTNIIVTTLLIYCNSETTLLTHKWEEPIFLQKKLIRPKAGIAPSL